MVSEAASTWIGFLPPLSTSSAPGLCTYLQTHTLCGSPGVAEADGAPRLHVPAAAKVAATRRAATRDGTPAWMVLGISECASGQGGTDRSGHEPRRWRVL
ncbi:hypothetical protein UB45_20055 [Terrabacter sp. 28]|nr:hypothetical protein UB45_20055 [Terrabacter sp. 28]